jgi:hypothetical protein
LAEGGKRLDVGEINQTIIIITTTTIATLSVVIN